MVKATDYRQLPSVNGYFHSHHSSVQCNHTAQVSPQQRDFNWLEDDMRAARDSNSLRYRHPHESALVAKRSFSVNEHQMRSFLQPLVERALSTNELRRVNVTFVTACSSNHFDESLAAVARIQSLLPGTTIVYYDIGLLPSQVALVAI